MLPGSPLPAFCPGPLARNGFSLACNGCRLSAASIPGSKLPACYFASLPDSSVPGPLFGSTAANPVCAGYGCFTASGPLHFTLPGLACRSCCLHSPPGFLHPSGSKRSTALAACRSTWRIRPIPSRSPLPVLMKVGTADHRSRAATFPPACCSSNLSEPPSLCSRNPVPSIFFGTKAPVFLKLYLRCFDMVTQWVR